MSKPSTLDRQLLLGAATIAMLMSVAPAYAQDAEEIEDEVVATGIKKSIEDALELKRDNSSIIEAITAEDIGKLPDVSIADSLARLPGVTAQRVRGRAQQISIRGLGPDFSLALLNGREVVSAGQNRGVEFDQFPSELISQGVVYKTSDARLAATGIAGAVDLRTLKPLDLDENTFNASARYVINDNGDLNPDFSEDGYRFFGSGVFQNEAKTLGLSLGVTHQSNPTQIFSRELKPGGQTPAFLPGTNTRYPTDNPRSGVESRDFKRTSVAGTLQFEPNFDFSASVDAFYSDFDDTGIFRGVETPLATAWTGDNPPTFVSGTGTGPFVDSVSYTSNPAILRTDAEGNEAEIFAIGGNVEFGVGEKATVMFDLSHSELDSLATDYESYAGTANSILYSSNNTDEFRDEFTFTTPSNGAYNIQTGRDYTNPNGLFLTDPGGWGQVGFLRQIPVEDELSQIRAEVEYDLGDGFLDSIAVGALHTLRDKKIGNNGFKLQRGSAFGGNDQIAIPADSIVGASDSGSIGFDIVAYDTSNFLDNGTYVQQPDGSTTLDISEEITTLYSMVELGGDNSRVRGNVGLQYVMVDQESTGQLGSFGTNPGTEATIGDDYDHWLPTLNLAFDASDNLVLRAGAGRSVTRPRIDDLGANLNVGSNPLVCDDTDGDGLVDSAGGIGAIGPRVSCLNFGGGNPTLRPYETTYGDLSAEYYFSPAGAFSLAGFYKDISDYVQGFSTVGNNPALAALYIDPALLAANPGLNQVTFGSLANVGTGSLLGFEAAVRLPLEDLFDAPILEGFGVNASYTYTDAEVDFEGTVVDIPGYSDEVASAEIYYEKDGFRARLNTRYRSGFQSEIVLFDGSNIGEFALSETVLDAQIGYDFDSRFGKWIEGTSINFEVYNITDEPFRTVQTVNPQGDTFVNRRQDFGTTYNFTIAKRF